ncbi:MAG: MFS family permease [Planctomycetota bacterium]|jgi:MFS family permease
MLRRYRRDLALLSPAARRYLLGSCMMGAAHAVPWALLALYLDLLGRTKQEIGFLQSCDSWGKVAVALPAAFLLARRRAAPLFVRAALVAGAGYMALPWLGSQAAMGACAFVSGLALAVHYVAIAPFLFRHTSPEERASVFGLAEAVRTMASVAGAFGAGRFVDWMTPVFESERIALGAAISLAGVACLFGAFFYARIEESEPSMAPDQRLLPILLENKGLLARFAIPQFVIAVGAGFCIPFLSLYFKERFSLAPGSWGSLFAAGQVLMTTGFLLTPWVLARMGFVRSIVFIEFASIPFFLVLAYSQSVAFATVAFLLRGALMNSTHPIHKNFMMQATPAGAREIQIGIQATLWGVGWVVGPLAAGHVLDATGNDYTILMLTTAGVYVVAGCLSWILLSPVETRMKREQLEAQASAVNAEVQPSGAV